MDEGRKVISDDFARQLSPETALPVAAIKTLIGVIRRSTNTTIRGMEAELKEAIQLMEDKMETDSPDNSRSTISLTSGCQLFLRHVSRFVAESVGEEGFDESCKQQLLHRGERFAEVSETSREQIARLGHNFVRDGTVVLTHGYSRCALHLLLMAAETKVTLACSLREGRPDGAGFKAAAALSKVGVPVTVVLDSAVGYHMEMADLCVTGAEGVLENGGIVNKVGTFQMAVLAKAYNVPFYVAAESYKFARLFPLDQRDLPKGKIPRAPFAAPEGTPESVATFSPSVDYTSAEYITLLFTDLGALTPSAVSDELIRLYGEA
ncbi:eukaryotic translation initiation factor 2B alpha subunit [Ectocarpus siliculosus]|uniref:Translation initiation factor eIF2B subunit alpha n=1 Tax=Ectocarpus siliculosus TaxID=2880 RepID=D8LNE0_ECTSI|nr:eukaryotic translation initiation factor 2B alpha subunit [Ectocarpus siliculosus]|eukprot:CBN77297.1 eukaryotic translation initiation factor 2B alpha subunit [Ectocarpus siliculosus]